MACHPAGSQAHLSDTLKSLSPLVHQPLCESPISTPGIIGTLSCSRSAATHAYPKASHFSGSEAQSESHSLHEACSSQNHGFGQRSPVQSSPSADVHSRASPTIHARLNCAWVASGAACATPNGSKVLTFRSASLHIDGQPAELTSCQCIVFDTPQVGQGHFGMSWLPQPSAALTGPPTESSGSEPLLEAVFQMNCSQWLSAAVSERLTERIQGASCVSSENDRSCRSRVSAASPPKAPPSAGLSARLTNGSWLQMLLRHSAVCRHPNYWSATVQQRCSSVLAAEASSVPHPKLRANSSHKVSGPSIPDSEATYVDVSVEHAALLLQQQKRSTVAFAHVAGAVFGLWLWLVRTKAAALLSIACGKLAWSFIQPQVTNMPPSISFVVVLQDSYGTGSHAATV